MHVQQAPQFTLEHIEGHPVSLSDYRGRTVVVVLSGRNSAEQMIAGMNTLRTHYDAEQLPIIAVGDMAGLPRAARALVKRQLKRRYKDAVEAWEGTVANSFGLAEVERDAAMVLIDPEGNVRGYGRGDQAAEQIMALFG